MFKLEICDRNIKKSHWKHQVYIEIEKNIMYWKKGHFLKNGLLYDI